MTYEKPEIETKSEVQGLMTWLYNKDHKGGQGGGGYK